MAERRFLTLDGMRGLAACVVLIRHMGGAPASVFSGGYLAVDFFFCLSGFVLAHAYGDAPLSVPGFLKARAIRLYPLYFAGLVLGVITALVVGVGMIQLLGSIALSAAFLPTPFQVPGEPGELGSVYPLNDPAWSLFFEIIANAAWFPLRRHLSGVTATLVLTGCVALYIACDLTYGAAAGPTWQNMLGGFGRVAFGFMAGVAIYKLWRRSTWRPAAPSWLIGLGLLVVLAAPVDRARFDAPAVLLLMPPLVFFGACCKPSGGWIAAAERLLGNASYPVYVLQMPIIVLLDQLAGPLRASGLPFVSIHPSLVTTPVTLILVIAGALWLDKVYDRPVRRWLASVSALPRARAVRAAE